MNLNIICVKHQKALDTRKNNNSNNSNNSQDPFYDNDTVKKVFAYVEDYIKRAKILHYGSTAYNFFVEGFKYPKEPVLNYEVYTTEDPDAFYLELLEELQKEIF